MTRRLVWLALASFVWGLPACGRVDDSTGSAHVLPRDREGAEAGAKTSGSGALFGNVGSPSTTGGTGAPGALAPAGDFPPLEAQWSIWIGQTEYTITSPIIADGSPGARRVELDLDALTTPVTGIIRFGEGPLPAPSPLDVYPTQTLSDGTLEQVDGQNWTSYPFPGFPYTLVSSELRGDRLVLSFAPLEVWTDWCQTQTSEEDTSLYGITRCDCTSTPCTGVDKPLVHVELVVSGDTMAGELSGFPGLAFGNPLSIRLQRVE